MSSLWRTNLHSFFYFIYRKDHNHERTSAFPASAPNTKVSSAPVAVTAQRANLSFPNDAPIAANALNRYTHAIWDVPSSFWKRTDFENRKNLSLSM